MAMTLQATRLRLTQAIYFGKPPAGGSGTVTSVAGGNGLTPGPIVGAGTIGLVGLTSDWTAYGNTVTPRGITSRNSVDVFNVLAYGAVADGATDSTAAIQAAITAATVKGGVVYFPIGEYRASGLTLTAAKGVTIKGAGYGYAASGNWVGSTVRTNGANSSTILTILDCQQCTAEDMRFDGNDPATTGITCIALESDNNPVSRMVTFNRVATLHCHIGLLLNSSTLVLGSQSDSVVVERFYFAESDATGIGVYVNSNNVSFLDVRSSVLLGGAYAFKFGYSGNTTIRNTYGGSGSQVFLSLQGPYDGILLDHCQTEQGGNFFEVVVPGSPNVAEPVQFRSCVAGGKGVVGVGTGQVKIISIGSLWADTFTLNGSTNIFTSIGDTFQAPGAIVAGGPLDVINVISADTTGRTGLGTATPLSTLQVNGTAGFDLSVGTYDINNAYVNGYVVSDGALTHLVDGGNNVRGGGLSLLHSGAGAVRLSLVTRTTTGTQAERLTVRESGNVGIGTEFPSRTLDLNGTERFRGIAAPAVSEANSATVYFDSGTNTLRASLNGSAYVDVIGSAGLTGSGTATKIGYWTGATTIAGAANIYTDAANHRLGVKVAAPAYQIDCDGDINLTTGSIIRVNALQVFSVDAANSVVSVGTIAGAIGANSTAVGYTALGSATGTDNSGLGAGALNAVTTGTGNTAAGSGAAALTTTGVSNTAVGLYAGLTNETGSNNVYIGTQADATANNLDNAIAIGYQANVAASDTMSLGNASMKVGIHTTTAKTGLDVDSAVCTRHKNIAVVNGLNSDIALTDTSWVRLTGPTGGFSIGGFTGGTDGRHLTIYNTVAQQMTIVNADASSAAANQITTLTGGNVVLRAGTSAASFIYEDVSDTWILVGSN